MEEILFFYIQSYTIFLKLSILINILRCNQKVILNIALFYKSCIEGRNINFLAPLIYHFCFILWNIRWVVRCCAVIFISKTDSCKWLIFSVYFSFYFFIYLFHYFSVLIVFITFWRTYQSLEDFRFEFGNKFSISEWLIVSTVLEYSCTVSKYLHPLVFCQSFLIQFILKIF
jgi:hypothetical protein